MNLIDITDFLPEEMQADAKERLKKGGNRLVKKTGQKAKLKKTKPFTPAQTYPRAKRGEILEQVIIYNLFTCRCSHSWAAPRHTGSVLDHIADTQYKSHFEETFPKHGFKHRVEYHTVSLDACPACFHDEAKLSDCETRMFKDIPEPELELDFEDPLFGYALEPKKQPLVPIGSPSIIRKGHEYNRFRKRTSALFSYPRYDKIHRIAPSFGGQACAISRP